MPSASKGAPELEVRLRTDFEYFCEHRLKINPKVKELVKAGADQNAGTLIPFRWNMAQREVWRVMSEQIEAGLPLSFVILKARQVGISTFFCAWIFWQMWRQVHTRAAIVAYEKKTTLAALNETMATFFDALPPEDKPKLRQDKRGARVAKEELYFADRFSNCRFIVQDKDAGRGIASDVVLCTEVSFYDNPDTFFGGFEPTMGSGSNSLLVKESSPSDGYFRGQYEDAKADGKFRRAIFIPWWWCSDLYSRKIKRVRNKLIDEQTGVEIAFEPALRKKQRHLSREAKRLGRPPITDEQMWWWRWFCDTKYQGDEEWMQQEFPDDDVTAFQKASRSAFKISLPMMVKTVEEGEELFPESMAGLLQSESYKDSSRDVQIVEFVQEHKAGIIDQERRAGLLMLDPPRPGFTYVVGADVADAEGEDDEEGERAFSVGCVYCCNTRNQVAEWRGHIDPTLWGDELVKLGYFYNSALLIIERNNMGVLTEHRINELGYPNQYRWPDWNKGINALTNRRMWETNARTKPMMLGTFNRWVYEDMFRVRTPGLYRECAAYLIKDSKYQAGDMHADRIIAAALTVMGAIQAGFDALVLNSPWAEDRSATGQAARILRASKQVPIQLTAELPAEFDDLGPQHVEDVFAAAGL